MPYVNHYSAGIQHSITGITKHKQQVIALCQLLITWSQMADSRQSDNQFRRQLPTYRYCLVQDFHPLRSD